MQYRVVMKKSALHLEGVTIWGNFWARCTAKALRSIWRVYLPRYDGPMHYEANIRMRSVSQKLRGGRIREYLWPVLRDTDPAINSMIIVRTLRNAFTVKTEEPFKDSSTLLLASERAFTTD